MRWNEQDAEDVLWPESYGLLARDVSQHEGPQDTNMLTLHPEERLVYAYFDSLERENPATIEGPLADVLRNVLDEQNAASDLLVARFDCVTVSYFNEAAPVFKAFYDTVRGEKIDEWHDLDKEYWHDPLQTNAHVALLTEFFESGKDQFRIVYLVITEHDAVYQWLERLGACEGWMGLGLAETMQPPYVASFTHDDHALDEQPKPMRLSSIARLTPLRLNNLRHVFSLDFAPDAVMPPGELPKPPLLPSSLLDRIRLRMRRENERLKGRAKGKTAKTTAVSELGLHSHRIAESTKKIAKIRPRRVIRDKQLRLYTAYMAVMKA